MANSKQDYSKLEKEDLLKIIKQLEARKKYGLIWDKEKTQEQFEKESEKALPVLKEVKGKEIKTDPAKPTNILIEGDNYHALSVLNYTHQGKIDVIYIDPPYNTGNKSWKYNNHYVEKEDTFKHSKWLSFMNKRLRLARTLLSDTGFIIITIDHYELFNLGALCDEIFGESNRTGIITVVHKSEGRQFSKSINPTSEYYLVYTKDSSVGKIRNIPIDEKIAQTFDQSDEIGKFRIEEYIRKGGGDVSLRINNPSCWYPIYVSKDCLDISLDKKKGYIEIFPVTESGQERTWNTSRKTFLENLQNGEIVAEKENDVYKICRKYREQQTIKTHWILPKYNATRYGTQLLNQILGKGSFEFPKSLYAVMDSLKITSDKNACILDFFAGSGTTGHAALEMNKEDGGNRQFILCTNNENKIAEEVTYPRLKKVIKGYYKNGVRDEKNHIEALDGNLKYFKTAFVNSSISQDDLKIRITAECTEMLCLREGIFDEVKTKPDYRIFEQNGKIMSIYYAMERGSLGQLKKELDKMKGEKILYCFTFDPLGLDKSDFVDWQGVSLESIPQKILDIYEQIYAY